MNLSIAGCQNLCISVNFSIKVCCWFYFVGGLNVVWECIVMILLRCGWQGCRPTDRQTEGVGWGGGAGACLVSGDSKVEA